MSEAETVGEQGSARSRRHTRLEAFYRRYSPWLVARLRRRFGADTEDLVQEIWLRVAAIEAFCRSVMPTVNSLRSEDGKNCCGT